MEEELKGCPFCGHDLSSYTNPFWEEDYMIVGTFYSVLCQKCQCKGPECSDKNEAREKWNHRKTS